MPEPIRVMSFNIRYGTAADGENSWKQRRELVFQTIREYEPDLLGLQEVLAFQAEELREALSDYEFVGVGRDDGQQAGEFGPIMYRKRVFLLVRAGHFWLSEKPEWPGSVGWDAALPRIVTWVRLAYKQSPQNKIYILNTHFDHQGVRARLESAKLVRRLVESLAGQPFIVLGDFNCGPGTPAHDELMAERGNLAELTDPFVLLRADTAGSATYHAFRGTVEGKRIDWILHNRRFQPSMVEIIHRCFNSRYPSDHYPVTATLRLLSATRWGVM